MYRQAPRVESGGLSRPQWGKGPPSPEIFSYFLLKIPYFEAIWHVYVFNHTLMGGILIRLTPSSVRHWTCWVELSCVGRCIGQSWPSFQFCSQLSVQERVWDDVAVAVRFRQTDLSWAHRFAVASPRFICCRSASTVLSHDCLARVARPILRLQLSGARWARNTGLESSVMILFGVGSVEGQTTAADSVDKW